MNTELIPKHNNQMCIRDRPKDRLRQCVFGGSSNTLDFLPLDRAGNRRFLPIMIYPENAEVHILEDEDASRAYLLQVWAEAMTIYRSGHYSMKFSKSIQRQLVEVQKDFMPEDTEAGQIQGFLEHYTGSMVCSKPVSYTHLELPEESRPIGRWGRMHKAFLQEHRPGQYNALLLSEKLWTYLADLNEQAADRLACIVSQMQEAEGVTEELKARDQLAWVGGMNSIRSRAEEIILSEMIFV